jgi:hypothetical protein
MPQPDPIGPTVTSNASTPTKTTTTTVVAGTATSWHHVVLWFLGGVAMLALADPAPTLATGLMIVLILGTLLNNWPVYKKYVGLK